MPWPSPCSFPIAINCIFLTLTLTLTLTLNLALALALTLTLTLALLGRAEPGRREKRLLVLIQTLVPTIIPTLIPTRIAIRIPTFINPTADPEPNPKGTRIHIRLPLASLDNHICVHTLSPHTQLQL